jgi:hypothetical protein
VASRECPAPEIGAIKEPVLTRVTATPAWRRQQVGQLRDMIYYEETDHTTFVAANLEVEQTPAPRSRG